MTDIDPREITEDLAGMVHVEATNSGEIPVGTLVRYWPGVREGEGKTGRTRSAVGTVGDGTPVVWIEGEAGCIALTHVERLDHDVDTRAIATDLMLGACREIKLDAIYDCLGKRPDRDLLAEEIGGLIGKATVTITWPEENR